MFSRAVIMRLLFLVVVMMLRCENHNVTASSGTTVCVEGIPMDRYCINLGKLLDNPSVVTLQEPYKHSVHCLIEVGPCLAGPYELLMAPTQPGQSLYKRAYELDAKGYDLLLSLAKRVGICSTCSGQGTVATGLRIQVRGTLFSSTSNPPVLNVTALAQSNGTLDASFCGPTDRPSRHPSAAPVSAKVCPCQTLQVLCRIRHRSQCFNRF